MKTPEQIQQTIDLLLADKAIYTSPSDKKALQNKVARFRSMKIIAETYSGEKAKEQLEKINKKIKTRENEFYEWKRSQSGTFSNEAEALKAFSKQTDLDELKSQRNLFAELLA